jgi:hypothetical protein
MSTIALAEMTLRSFFFIVCNSLVLFFCVGAPEVSAQSILTQRLDFEANNQPVGEALIRLSRASGASIGFSEEIFERPRYVRISAQNERLSNILDQILEGSGIGWRETGGQILLFKKPPPERILSGFIEDATSGERLVGALVMDMISGRSATSNGYGFFSLQLPGGKSARLFVSMLGFQLVQMQLAAGPDQRVQLLLQPLVSILSNVEVSGDSVETRLEAFFSKKEENLMRMPIHLLPSPGGETDLMRAASLLPGIESSFDGLGGWSVRGGDVDQNLVMVDDAVVFSPSHGLGLFSVFNPDIVRSARLWKGDAPARFGGRTSSILDVRTREGNMQQITGSVSVGWMAVRASMEVPLKKDRGAVLFSARRSLASPILEYFTEKNKSKEGVSGSTAYLFSDLNLKANWTFNDRNRVYLSLYEGRDLFNDRNRYAITDSFAPPEAPSLILSNGTTYDWKNRFGSLRWNHLFSDKCFSNTTLTASRFTLQSLNKTNLDFEDQSVIIELGNSSTVSNTKLHDLTFRNDVDWFATEHLTLRGGAQASMIRMLPFLYLGNAINLPFWATRDSTGQVIASAAVGYEWGLTLAAYGEAEWMPTPNWRVRAGFRAETFSRKGTTHFLPQPRLYAERRWQTGWFASASWSEMAQVLRTVSPNVLESTNDVWLMSSSNLPPQRTSQVTGGLGRTWRGWGARAEIFLKKMRNLEEYDARWYTVEDTFSYIDPEQFVQYQDGVRSWENEVAIGEGRAVGIEFLLEKNTGRTTGWVSWTLFRSKRRFDDLNGGQWFFARFDRPQNLKTVIVHQIGRHFSVAANWQLAAGDAVSSIVLSNLSSVFGIPSQRLRLLDLHQGSLAASRLGYGDIRQPWQHRLDVSCTWQWAWGRSKHQISVGAYNFYNRTNPHFTYLALPDFEGVPIKQTVNGLPILPHLTWGVKF